MQWQIREFQSTPSSRKVTLLCLMQDSILLEISIHTFLAEGDSQVSTMQRMAVISIHTFLAEGDKVCCTSLFMMSLFQSTPSSRKVTNHEALRQKLEKFQSTPSSRKVTNDSGRRCRSVQFQSTPSSRKVTVRLSMLPS